MPQITLTGLCGYDMKSKYEMEKYSQDYVIQEVMCHSKDIYKSIGEVQVLSTCLQSKMFKGIGSQSLTRYPCKNVL